MGVFDSKGEVRFGGGVDTQKLYLLTFDSPGNSISQWFYFSTKSLSTSYT